MKTILCTLIIFSITTIYSQSFEDLKKLDTIYIPYNGKINEKKYNIQTRITENDFKEKAFVFSLDNFHLSFDYVKFKGWEKKDANIRSEKKIVKKSFLKKNNNKIISPDLLNQYDSEKIYCDILSQNKVFYILDFTEKRRKIIAYEVIFIGYCPGKE